MAAILGLFSGPVCLPLLVQVFHACAKVGQTSARATNRFLPRIHSLLRVRSIRSKGQTVDERSEQSLRGQACLLCRCGQACFLGRREVENKCHGVFIIPDCLIIPELIQIESKTNVDFGTRKGIVKGPEMAAKAGLVEMFVKGAFVVLKYLSISVVLNRVGITLTPRPCHNKIKWAMNSIRLWNTKAPL